MYLIPMSWYQDNGGISDLNKEVKNFIFLAGKISKKLFF